MLSSIALSPPMLIVALAACLELVRLLDIAAPLLPAAVRRTPSFAHFYPSYLKEHSQLSTKRCHYAGTAALLLLLVRTPSLLPALAAALLLGLASYPYLQWLPTGAADGALMVGAYLLCAMLSAGWAAALAPLLVGYGAAWVGHFVFEKNRPATFIYPAFSLLGDLRMFAEMCAGRQPR